MGTMRSRDREAVKSTPWRRVRGLVERFFAGTVVGEHSDTKSLGQRGERVAEAYLKKGGYRILARNLTSRVGEIDLLAEAPDGRTVVVVEVKAGVAGNPPPEVHVNAAKRRKLIRLVPTWARRLGMTDRPWRFDVVAVVFSEGEAPEVRHHMGAFDERGRVR